MSIVMLIVTVTIGIHTINIIIKIILTFITNHCDMIQLIVFYLVTSFMSKMEDFKKISDLDLQKKIK